MPPFCIVIMSFLKSNADSNLGFFSKEETNNLICGCIRKEQNVTQLTEEEARTILSERGHKNIVTVTYPKGHVNDAHDHPFDADAIVISGNIKILISDKEYHLNSGDEFQLAAGIEHSEFIGEDGVRLVAARPDKQ